MSNLQLNTLAPAEGSKHTKHRVGRGEGSGWGKTSGRGHKGQKARTGYAKKIGFEGGQMPLQRRLPKRGFSSPIKHLKAEVRLSELQLMQAEEIDVATLKAEGIVGKDVRYVKVIRSGELSRKVNLKGIKATAGARSAIEAAGGSLTE